MKLETAVVRWKKVTLIGVGLLGGSVGLALKQNRLADLIVGFVRRRASVPECQALGAVDLATCDLKTAVEGAELVVLCTPVSQMRPLVEEFAGCLRPGAVVTDVGGVKTTVVKPLEPLIHRAGGYFVGSHPMAGSHRTGVAAARQDLFEGAVCVVTPTANSSRAAIRKTEYLWRSLGMRVLRLSPATHDQLVSRSSHLPQIIASQLAKFVLDPTQPKEQAVLCAGGFRDTTRLASSSPEMWRDIALGNRDNILRALDRFEAGLRDFRRILRKGNPEDVFLFFEQAKARRDGWLAKSEDRSPKLGTDLRARKRRTRAAKKS